MAAQHDVEVIALVAAGNNNYDATNSFIPLYNRGWTQHVTDGMHYTIGHALEKPESD